MDQLREIVADKPLEIVADKPLEIAADKPLEIVADKPLEIVADEPPTNLFMVIMVMYFFKELLHEPCVSRVAYKTRN